MALKDFEQTGKRATREGFGAGIHSAGEKNDKVIMLTADLRGSMKADDFINAHPDRFVQCGISEANMMGVAAGLATAGKIPMVTTFANFATGRVYDQIRQSIAYSHKNVKICASHAGLTLGEDGATHQILEDIGMMRMLPGMTVINPCDFNQTKAAVEAITDHYGPCYLRFGRPGWPIFTNPDQKLEIGKALHMSEGTDITLFATGHLVWYALEAARQLEEEGISVELINIHTIKPLDEAAVLASAAKTGAVVSCEEHNKYGGLGSAIAEVLAAKQPTPQEFVAVNDSFGESGTSLELLEKYGLSPKHIIAAAKRAIARK